MQETNNTIPYNFEIYGDVQNFPTEPECDVNEDGLHKSKMFLKFTGAKKFFIVVIIKSYNSIKS